MFRVTIPRWQSCESNSSPFVVYSIQVVNTSDGKSHTIGRRYRDFHKLNKKIKKLFNISIGFPPKRMRHNMNRKFIEQRRQALEQYLRTLVLMDSVPPQVLRFLDMPNDLIGRLERERLEKEGLDVLHSNTTTPTPLPVVDRTADHNPYPMITFRHDVNNVCYSQTSSSSSLNDIIVNGVIDGFYSD